MTQPSLPGTGLVPRGQTSETTCDPINLSWWLADLARSLPSLKSYIQPLCGQTNHRCDMTVVGADDFAHLQYHPAPSMTCESWAVVDMCSQTSKDRAPHRGACLSCRRRCQESCCPFLFEVTPEKLSFRPPETLGQAIFPPRRLYCRAELGSSTDVPTAF